jgi:hypothetical protein
MSRSHSPVTPRMIHPRDWRFDDRMMPFLLHPVPTIWVPYPLLNRTGHWWVTDSTDKSSIYREPPCIFMAGRANTKLYDLPGSEQGPRLVFGQDDDLTFL